MIFVSDYTFSAPPNGLFGVVTPGHGGVMSTNNPSDDLIIAFTSGKVTAVGADFFLTDSGGNLAAGFITVTLSDGTSLTLSSESFEGFTSGGPLITSLTLHSDGGGWASIDHLYVGEQSSVPDDGTTAVLLGIGTLGVIGLHQKFDFALKQRS